MSDEQFSRAAAGIGALADPVRLALYDFVCTAPAPVTREQAAEAVGIPVHRAKFQLDRLESDGLLSSDYERPSGRTGPGAGRPAKVYQQSGDELAVSVPPRGYDLAGELMAEAISSTAAGGSVVDALHAAAADKGRALGSAGGSTAPPGERPGSGPGANGDPLAHACAVLAEQGYRPRVEDDRVVLVNCPFHALAQRHTALVCGMNLALIDGLTQTLDPERVVATLDPAPGRCCVTLHRRT